MKLFHGTHRKEEILADGFCIGESRYTEDEENCVYFSDTEAYAAQHGFVVEIEIDEAYVELYQENPLCEDDYGYIPGDEYYIDKENLDKITIVG